MRTAEEIESEMKRHMQNGDYDARNALVAEWRKAYESKTHSFSVGEEVEYLFRDNDWRRVMITKIVSNFEIHIEPFGIVPLSVLRKKEEKHEQLRLL